MDPAGILLQTPIFRDLAPEDVVELLPDLRERQFARGQTVWVEGDRTDALYIVAEGQLKSHRVSRDGGEVILRLHPAVDVVGEVGLFHPSGIRQVSVSAMSPSRCLTLGHAPLMAFLTRHPIALQRMLEQLSLISVQAAYSFSGVAFDDIRHRVAVALVGLAEEFGEKCEEGVRIRLQLSQGTLAALVAASRENVNRALSTFVSSGVVSHRDGHFHLHDLAALEQAAMASGDIA
jgi:CRP/FNR family transcriptional regulator